MKELQIVEFRLENKFCGVISSQVNQILSFKDVVKKPNMPKIICGQINWSKTNVALICLNNRMSPAETEVTKKTRIILTQIDNQFIGFIVEEIIKILKKTEDSILDLPEIIKETGNENIKGFVNDGGKLVSILDLKNILTNSEVKEIKEYFSREHI